MNDPNRRFIVLGPQQEYRTLRTALERIDVDGTVALITAGWEVDELDDLEIRQAIPNDVVNLRLFERSELLFDADKQLIQRLRDRQDELRYLRDAYRARLDYALSAARQMIQLHRDSDYDLEPEVESAIDQIRQLDKQYFVRTSQVCDQYDVELQVENRPQVLMHREQLLKTLEQCAALVISGGHAAIILNRLKIFGILELAPKMPVIACSGGAMALSDQIVFFHDSPPQGAGNPEVLRAGMGVLPGVLPLPDASNRLDLEDQNRVELFARRFSQYLCLELNEQTLLEQHQGKWQLMNGTRQLGDNGKLWELSL